MAIFACFLLFLVIYHHVGYPLLLKGIASYRSKKMTDNHQINNEDLDCLPSIHIVIPAYNEERVIQQKIDSLSWLDYPDDKLSISIYCDGCNDKTVNRAIKGQGQFYNRELDIRIVNITKNSGKVAIINRAIAECDADLIAFSDASAILSSDTLWLTAQQFMNNSNVAVVTGNYSLCTLNSKVESGDSVGEQAYWNYQNKVRSFESKLGAVMGVTGAYFAIRRDKCDQLEPDTINDDFILPMCAVAKGGLSVFDPKIHILETESTPLKEDAQRRRRISQGNMQQVIRLKSLLLPGFNFSRFWVSWMFSSGKFLRVLMPYLLLTLFAISAFLATNSVIFFILLTGQLAVYLIALIHLYNLHNNLNSKIFNNKLVQVISYLCQGHLMGLIGSASYLQHLFRHYVFGIAGEKRWHKIIIKNK
jgi:cellulose synthase/poly-beta-1,6-N-acetylglucosamine synthase-like glycosyltransferase